MKVRYCSSCCRWQQGRPRHCQFCGRSWDGRICFSCGQLNAPNALFCGWCGKETLSEMMPPVPIWARVLPFLLHLSFWLFLFWLFGSTLLLPIVLILAAYFILPESVRRFFGKGCEGRL